MIKQLVKLLFHAHRVVSCYNLELLRSFTNLVLRECFPKKSLGKRSLSIALSTLHGLIMSYGVNGFIEK